MGFCFCWVSSPSGASVVWGGWDTNTPSFSLPAQQKGARRGEGLPHIDFGAACTTHTPHPCLIFFYSQVKLVPDYASFARSRAENELWLPGSQIGSDDPNGSPGMAVLAVMTLRWERPTCSNLSKEANVLQHVRIALKQTKVGLSLMLLPHKVLCFISQDTFLCDLVQLYVQWARGKARRNLYLSRFSL